MENEKTTPIGALLINGVPVFLLERDKIRKALDPDSKWITDSELNHILAIVGGNLHRGVVRTLLSIQQKAQIAKDSSKIMWCRSKMSHFEAGVLVI